MDAGVKLGPRCKNLSYSMALYEINCIERSIRILTLTHYDNKRNVIDSSSSSSEWGFIIPESVGEGITEACPLKIDVGDNHPL